MGGEPRTERQYGILVITMNRPGARNALNGTLTRDTAAAVEGYALAGGC